MTFPFVIELERKIKTADDTASVLNVFDIIQAYLKSKSVDDFYKTENTIKFKKGFFGMNTNVFSLIDKGEFELVENKGEFKLKYRFYMLWFFVISTIMVTIFSILSGQFIFGLVLFFSIVVCNFLVSLVRQQGVMNDLIYNIDEAYRNRKASIV